MTCGCCHPEAFRENGNRVFGYVVADRMGQADTGMRQLHYLGAEHVFTDKPIGRVKDRPGLKLLRKLMCPGDKLLLADERALGTKPDRAEANMAMLEAKGLQVAIVRKEFFEN